MNKFFAALVGALILVTSPAMATDISQYDALGGPQTDLNYCIKKDGKVLSNQEFVDINEEAGGEIVGIFPANSVEGAIAWGIVQSIKGEAPETIIPLYFSFWVMDGVEFIVVHGNGCAIAYVQSAAPVEQKEL